MSGLVAGEHESFARWFTGELRGKVGELTRQPGGDFCADLADWLVAAGHVRPPSEQLAHDRELANLRMERDRAWHQLTVTENALRATRRTAPAAVAGFSSVVEV